jgi:hypothetical protein
MKKRVIVASRPRKKKKEKELFCLQKFWFGGGGSLAPSLSQKTTVAWEKWKVDRAKVSGFFRIVRTGKGRGAVER